METCRKVLSTGPASACLENTQNLRIDHENNEEPEKAHEKQ